jgi:hypothetical protein
MTRMIMTEKILASHARLDIDRRAERDRRRG